jgi:membrane-bound ClpP family serine protease
LITFQARACKILVALLVALAALSPGFAQRAVAASVRVIELHGSIGPGEASFADKQLTQAWKSGDSGVILDLDS